jgi:hypothetical protein
MINQPVYDNYAISGRQRIDEGGKPDSASSSLGTCDNADAQCYTLYGQIEGQGSGAIGDFSSREEAEQAYFRITGEPFTGSYQAGQRLRLMHAAPLLLEALRGMLEVFVDCDQMSDYEDMRTVIAARSAIVEATASCPPWVSADIDTYALLGRRQEIADIWGTDDVQAIRPDLTGARAWEVLKAAQENYDATIGINWEVLACQAQMLFGDAPKPTKRRRHGL